MIEKIKKYDPDVIHLHNLHGYYLNIEILFHYLTQADKPVIWTLHGCWSFTRHCTHFDYIECEKWKTGCEHCPQKHTYPKSYLMDASKWNYQKKQELFTSVNNMIIVTPSHWLAGLVKQSYLSKYPVEVIHNGIDLDVFKPIESDFRQTYDLENKRIVLGVASVWDERKGLDTFIALSKKLPRNYKIVLVGLSEKQIKEIPKEILGIIRTDSVQELAEIYIASDVLVNPTLEDNFPITNLEALACGTPVITYDTGGSSECLDEKRSVVVEKEKFEALVKAIFEFKEIPIGICINKSKELEKRNKFSEYIKKYGEIQ